MTARERQPATTHRERRRLPRTAWLLGAMLSAMVVVPMVHQLLSLLPARGTDLANLGVTAAELADAPGLASRARRVAAGKLAAASGLDDLAPAGGGSPPGTGLEPAPEPLRPRWSAVAEPRPEIAWRAPPSTAELELLLVDERESLVGTVVLPADAPAGEGAPYPAELPSLRPGGRYAWRLSARLDDGWRSSVFVPFRVLTAGEIELLQLDLAEAGDDPFLRAVAYLASGLDRPGLLELSRATATPAGRDRARRIALAVFERQRLPDELAVRELERLFPKLP